MGQITPLPINPPPGLVATESGRVVEGRWILPWNWFRFMNGKPQKMGGWIQAFVSAASGIPHAILAWTDLTINRYIAAGTYRKLYVYDTAALQNDITPIRISGSLTNPFTTTSGSAVVSVAHTAHGVGVGDQVLFTAVAAAVGGIPAANLIGSFIVLAITDVNNYTFNCGTNASSSAGPGGGAVSYEYEINIGTEQSAFGLGWGVGGWGLGTWGTARANSTIVFEQRIWTLDHFGKLLVAGYNGGTIYTFDPTQAQPWGGAAGPRALPIAAAVSAGITDLRSVFVTPERFVVALRDNLVVSACSQGDYTTWVPASNNSAWSRTLTDGSRLMGGAALAPFQSLIWTDGAAYMFQWTGDAFIYRSSLLSKNCGLIGPNAKICINGVAFWMTPNTFMMYDGSVHPIPNVEDIRKYVIDNLTSGQLLQVSAGYNPINDEVWFNLPMFGSTTPNMLLIFHRGDNCWSLHSSTRVSMTNFVNGDNRPYLGDTSGFIYQHEVGLDGAGVAITSTMTLGPYALSASFVSMDVQGIVFDPFQQVGDITVTFNGYDEITDTTTIDAETEVISVPSGLTDLRVSGRYMGFTATQSSLGAYFRYGSPVARVMTTGTRM